MRLTQQQYQTLISLLQSNNRETSNTEIQVNQMSTVTSGSTQQGDFYPIINLYASKRTNMWIFDSGATDHVTCSLDNFCSYKEINLIVVHLPNNAKVTATHIGSVQLNEKLLLKDVLFIPTFGYNLISISKLVSCLNIDVVFTQDLCVIQDTNTKERIGLASTYAGLSCIITQKVLLFLMKNIIPCIPTLGMID